MFCIHACSLLVRRYCLGDLAWDHIDFPTLSLIQLFVFFCIDLASATFITQLSDESVEAPASAKSVAEVLHIRKPLINHAAEWVLLYRR